MPAGPINTDRYSGVLRRRGVDLGDRKVLITRFDGSEQEHDLSEPSNCRGHGRLRHFHRETAVGWPDNPLPIDPARRFLRLEDDHDALVAQVFQNAVCNWRCWYCYVDFPLLSGNLRHATMYSVDELIDMYLDQPDPPLVIDLTGGQPDLVPEWIPWTLEALERRGLTDRVYVWSDDNLSNDYFWSKLSRSDRTRINDAPNYGKVCCFKGIDEQSFAFNTAASPSLFARQFDLMRRLVVDTSIDLYAYVTFTTPIEDHIEAKMRDFVDRLQAIDERLPLRTVPLQIQTFTPTAGRMTAEHERALIVQEELVAAWSAEMHSRFDDAARPRVICDVDIRRT